MYNGILLHFQSVRLLRFTTIKIDKLNLYKNPRHFFEFSSTA
jgi:hypothetical protein